MNDRERFLVTLSMFGGLGVGVLGNLVVAATFYYIEHNHDIISTAIYGVTWISFLAVLAVFLLWLNRWFKKL